MLKIPTINTFKNMELFSKWRIAWSFDFSCIESEATILRNIFLKFSAPPLFHRNCWDLAALMTTGSSAGVSTSNRYLNFQFLSCAR